MNKYGQGEKQGGKIVEKTLNLKAIGVGIPAVIDVNSGAVTNAPLYGSLRGLNLKEKLEDYFNVPIYVENVVKLSALGEKNNGEGKNYKNIVFIEISNGIGAGIIVDNHLLRGTYGSAGEIGFSIINNKNLGFIIKNKGWLEKNASVESIKERAAKKIQKGAKTLILDFINKDINNLNPSIVCEAAVRNDKVSKDIISEIVEYLALGIINLILILNPQIIVLGGDICNLPEVHKLFINPIRVLVNESIPFEIPEIKLSSLGEDAGVVGASFLAIESLLLGEFPYTIDFEVFS
ncbi:N-acetylmannosamine kinase [subsurface metagenome]